MNLAKKALSLGTSAALVASLVATVAAPAVFASTSVVSAGSIAAGSTSTGTASFTFTENSATAFTGPGTLTVTILDYAGANTLTFSGGVLAAPGSLGASLAVSGNTFTVTTTGNDNNNVEQITVSGLHIAATTAAAAGGISAKVTGSLAGAVLTATTTATGYLYTSVSSTATTGEIAVTSSCPFVATGTGAGPAADLVINGVDVGSATFGAGHAAGYQAFTVAALSAGYPAGVAVSQASVPNCSGSAIASPGTIGSIVTQNATSAVVYPGENNQPAGTTTAVEPSAGFLAAGSTATFTLPSGVLFSSAPTAQGAGNAIPVAAPTLSYSVLAGPSTPAVTGGLTPAGTYYFEVTAKGASSGETGPSNPVGPVTCAAACVINLSWTADPGAFSYNVYESSSLMGTYDLVTTPAINPVGTTSVQINNAAFAATGAAAPTSNNAVPAVAGAPTGLNAGHVDNAVAGANYGTVAAGTYYFVATAKTGTTGETVASSVLSATVTAAQGTAGAEIVLSWPAVTGANGYYLYQGASAVGPFFGTHTATMALTATFTSTPAPAGTQNPPTVGTAGNATSVGALTVTGNTCALSFDRTSCTVTINTASTVASAIALTNIKLDLASTVANGTSVTATLTGSPAFSVYVNSNVIAVVNRTLVGVGATPTVWIGYNAQQSGVLTITETAAGFLQAGLNNNNAFQVCVADYNPTNVVTPSERFTFAPWAVVTTGNVSLLNTTTNVGASSVQGSLNASNTCATWTVYAASTTASTITIVGATTAGALSASVPTNGPTLNIDPAATPGPVTLSVGTGTLSGSTFTALYSTNAVNAIRAFKSGVVVTAVTQPYIGAGTIGPAGNITVAETLNGQLVAGETFTCQLLQPNAENNAFWISSQNSNNLPIVATNLSSGLVAHLVSFPNGSQASTFSVYIDQQAVAPNSGVVTISNLNYQTATGAPLGPINVECYNASVTVTYVGTNEVYTRVPSTGAAFDQFISNAINGSTPTLAPLNVSAVSALGLNPTSGYSTKSLKVQAKGKYVTWKFSGGAALAGQTVKILVTTAVVPGVWGPWKPLTLRIADANGIATFHWTSKTAASISVRAEWMGNATYGDSLSPARGVTWK